MPDYLYTLAGDESGDISFNFRKGSTLYFVISIIATDQPEKLRQYLLDIRSEAYLSDMFEFSHHSLSSRLRERTFASLAKVQFNAWGIVINKTILPDAFRIMQPLEFYLFFVSELIRSIPAEMRRGSTLVMDEFSAATRLPVELRRILRVRKVPFLFKRVIAKRSKSESLIQIADLVAGSIYRCWAKDETTSYDMISSKLNGLLEYRP